MLQRAYHEMQAQQVRVRLRVLNATFNSISVISCHDRGQFFFCFFLCGENHRPVASHWQTLSHNVASSSPCMSEFRFHNFSGGITYCIGTTTIRSWQPGKSTMVSSCSFIITAFKFRSKYLSEKTNYSTTCMKHVFDL